MNFPRWRITCRCIVDAEGYTPACVRRSHAKRCVYNGVATELSDFGSIGGIEKCSRLVSRIHARVSFSPAACAVVSDSGMSLPTGCERKAFPTRIPVESPQWIYIQSVDAAFEVTDTGLEAPVDGRRPRQLRFRAFDGRLAGIGEKTGATPAGAGPR